MSERGMTMAAVVRDDVHAHRVAMLEKCLRQLPSFVLVGIGSLDAHGKKKDTTSVTLIDSC